MSKEIRIDTTSKETMMEGVREFQKNHDECLEVCNAQKAQLAENLTTIKEAKEHIKNLEESVTGFVSALKSVHILLGARADKFKGDAEMKVVMDSLATLVMSSTAIKLGVIEANKNK